MYYCIYAEDSRESLAKRKAARQDHMQRIDILVEEGRLLLAGPFPAVDGEDPGEAGFTGSLIVAEFDSLEEAREWAESDPYRTAGVYEKVTVKPFRKAVPP